MNGKLEKGAEAENCCPSNEGGINPIPGGAICGNPGLGGKCEVLVTVKRSILICITGGGTPLGKS